MRYEFRVDEVSMKTTGSNGEVFDMTISAKTNTAQINEALFISLDLPEEGSLQKGDPALDRLHHLKRGSWQFREVVEFASTTGATLSWKKV